MDPNSGKLYDLVDEEELKRRLLKARQAFVTDERRMATGRGARKAGLVRVMRDITVKERAEQQIHLYSPCGCGSGKKFKFCCKAKS